MPTSMFSPHHSGSALREPRGADVNASARLAAFYLLSRLDRGKPLEAELRVMDARLPEPRDRRFARELVLGCLRWQQRLDHIAGCFTHRPVAGLNEKARRLLRLGLYQLLWMDRVPDHAAIHTTVELAKRLTHAGIVGMINAVLRKVQREPERISYPDAQTRPAAHLALVHSHPSWLVRRWLDRWGVERTEALLRANNTPAGLFIAVNIRRTTASALRRELEAAGIETAPCEGFPDYLAATGGASLFATAAFAEGRFFIQDINAGLAAALLAPTANARILDLCSAPGGKTTQLALRSSGATRTVAADIDRQRLGRVAENRKRLGLSHVELLVQDARRSALRAGSFNYVLADVPCSGTGTLGRRPDARWRRSPDQLPDLAERQRRILAAAFELTAPGGVLVYSTCSLEPEENEQVVEHLLEHQSAAVVEAASERFPQRAWAGRFIQTLPGREPGDGNFAARIRRQET